MYRDVDGFTATTTFKVCEEEGSENCVEMACNNDSYCCADFNGDQKLEEGECANCEGADLDESFNPEDCKEVDFCEIDDSCPVDEDGADDDYMMYAESADDAISSEET